MLIQARDRARVRKEYEKKICNVLGKIKGEIIMDKESGRLSGYLVVNNGIYKVSLAQFSLDVIFHVQHLAVLAE